MSSKGTKVKVGIDQGIEGLKILKEAVEWLEKVFGSSEDSDDDESDD